MAAVARAVKPWRALAAGALALFALAIGHVLSNAQPERTASSLSSLPLAAQGPVSAALGASERSYRVGEGRDGLRLSNPAQRLHARFGRAGMTVGDGALRVALRLRAIGSGSLLTDVRAAFPRGTGNRVSYARGAVEEWYANGPLGLEQGFALARPPEASGSGRLTLAMSLGGNGRATLTAGGHAAVFRRGVSELRYTGLLATDASGRRLPSRLALRGGTLLIEVAARDARYPLRIDPLVQQGAKLTPNDEQGPGGEAGTSVALSADGSTALIGGIGDEPNGKPMEGAAWVFARSGSTWSEQAKLTGGGEQGEGQFGISVALSGDGDTALVGGINDETGGNQLGAAWVFTRAGSIWKQQGAKLVAKPGEESVGGRFGRSVALSADGATALIGGYFDNGQHGAAWVFARSGSTWAQQGAKLTGGGEEGEGQFGFSAALSSDGDAALIGAPHDEGSTKEAMAGAAWVFTRSGTAWTQQGPKLTSGGAKGAGELGAGVALSADGSTALLGAPGDAASGGARAFTRTGASWSQQGAELLPSDATAAAGFGTAVALSADGASALIGGPVDKDSAVPTGAAWDFARVASTWVQQGSKLLGAGEAPESELGAAAALSADGATALLGAPIDAANTGAAWVFVDPPPTATTASASSVGSTAATLNGTVGLGPSATSYFQYGATTAYGSSTPGQSSGRTDVTAPFATGPAPGCCSISAALTGLAPATTYHFRLVTQNSAGVSVGAEQTFTTGAPIPPIECSCATTLTAPVLSRVSQSRRVWRVGRRQARVSARRRARAPIGTTFSFTLNVAARVRFTFAQRVDGREAGGRCVPPAARYRRRPPCKRAARRAALFVNAHAGADKLSFQGAIGRIRLKPGSYTVTLVATSGTRNSAPKSLAFTIVR